MLLVFILSACERYYFTVTGGGAATVTLSDDDAGTIATWTVDGLDEDDLDEVFSHGHRSADVLAALEDRALEPGHRPFYATVGERDIGAIFVGVDGLRDQLFCEEGLTSAEIGVEPTYKTTTAHYWGRVQGSLRFGSPSESYSFENCETSFCDHDPQNGEEELSYFYDGVFTRVLSFRCPDGPAHEGTLSIDWTLDPEVSRTAHDPGGWSLDSDAWIGATGG